MNPSQLVEQAKTKLKAAVSRFQDDLKTLRTGRAHPSMLDGVTVEAYGTTMPLIQAGSITTPEAQLLQITPFDPANLAAISAAIRDNQALGLNPMDDGRVVRIQIPPLNEERRRDFVKILGGKVEDYMVSLRNIRHDAQKELDQAKKDRDIGEDEWSRTLKQIDEAMNQAKSDVETAAKAKENEILTI
ncbi:MAG TPA: ribosome recycling factor [Candidatus Saccharimonadales bacterium]|nr:ribosome recycling factor [Candidatus Saccharimonadales bacterium]